MIKRLLFVTTINTLTLCIVFALLNVPAWSFADGQQYDGYNPAVINGRRFEELIQKQFEKRDVSVARFVEWRKDPNKFPSTVLLTNAPYSSLFGKHGKTEFLFLHDGQQTRIEAKWQKKHGTAENKIAYTLLNAFQTMPEAHIVIVLDGPGWSEGVRPWLDQVVDDHYPLCDEENPVALCLNRPDKKVEIMSLGQLAAWLDGLALKKKEQKEMQTNRERTK